MLGAAAAGQDLAAALHGQRPQSRWPRRPLTRGVEALPGSTAMQPVCCLGQQGSSVLRLSGSVHSRVRTHLAHGHSAAPGAQLRPAHIILLAQSLPQLRHSLQGGIH